LAPRSSYGAHGGDLGSGVTTRLAARHPEAVAGIHLTALAPPELGSDAVLIGLVFSRRY
jgi:pimeloyl-ACP methyl ester carboxylesterase